MRIILSKKTVFLRLLAMTAGLAALGWLLDMFYLILLLWACTIIGWHYEHMFMLDRWLWRDRKLSPPKGTGVWQQIFDGIYYRQRKQRKKNKELRALIRRFRDGAETLPDAIVLLSKEWHIHWCNKLAQQHAGLRWPADEGQRLDNLIRNPEFKQFIESPSFDSILEQTSPISEAIALEYRMLPYGEDEYLLIIRDITKMKQLEQVRKDFVANVSHELRTPLTVLQGYLEVMEPDDLPPPPVFAKAHGVMLEQTKRMDALVRQLLTLSRIEAGSKIPFEQHVDVPAMLKMLEQEAQELNRTKNHQIEFRIAPGLGVSGVSDELRSAFSNLISNAIKYTPCEGRIQVSWQLQGENACFKVVDNGDGIAEAHIKRLTERFYRVDQARARNTGGTGLGLAIVKHVLSRYQSQLTIHSELKHGSEFSFEIPKEWVQLYNNH